MSYLGYGAAIISAFFNGTFPSMSKIRPVAVRNVHPFIFLFYTSFGVFLSSWLVVPFLQYNDELTLNQKAGKEVVIGVSGIIAGVLFSLSTAFAFLSISFIGVSLAQGSWGGVAMLVSFIWGVAYLKDPVITNVAEAAGGIVMLILGVFIIAFSGEIIKILQNKGVLTYVVVSDEIKGVLSEKSGFDIPSKDREISWKSRLVGFFFAILTGTIGGSILVPSSAKFTPDSLQGLAFLPSLGIGALASAIVIAVIFSLLIRKIPEFHPWPVCPAGILAGIMWNLSNVFSLYANARIGFGIAQPILQCALFFAGLWGIIFFREITGFVGIFLFFLGSCVLISGAIVLAFSSAVQESTQNVTATVY